MHLGIEKKIAASAAAGTLDVRRISSKVRDARSN
jgi:hypothetical protein